MPQGGAAVGSFAQRRQVGQQVRTARGLGDLALGRLGHRKHAGLAQHGVVDQRPGADAAEQGRLRRLQVDQPTQHVQHVEQLGRVLGQPAVGLDVAQRRGLAAVADERALTVFLRPLNHCTSTCLPETS